MTVALAVGTLDQTCTRSSLNLLQIALDDEMFDVGPSNHKSLTHGTQVNIVYFLFTAV